MILSGGSLGACLFSSLKYESEVRAGISNGNRYETIYGPSNVRKRLCERQVRNDPQISENYRRPGCPVPYPGRCLLQFSSGPALSSGMSFPEYMVRTPRWSPEKAGRYFAWHRHFPRRATAWRATGWLGQTARSTTAWLSSEAGPEDQFRRLV